MNNYGDAERDGHYLGEYVDEAALPEELAYLRDRPPSAVKIERPRFIGEYLDIWNGDKFDE